MTSAADRAEEVVALWKERRDRGEALSPEDLVGLYPDLADEIRLRLAVLDLLDRALAAESPSPAPLLDHPDFRILRELGRGGMGVVYEAEQVSMRRVVALKVLYPAVTLRPKAVERFRREAQAAGRLHHTNLVPVHGMGEAKGVWFYVMERVQGRPLSDLIADLRGLGAGVGEPDGGGASTAFASGARGLSWHARVAEAFAGLAEALEHAHAQGILHRDVKPANVMLDRDGTLRLTDFGLAAVTDGVAALTVTGDLVGTPAYMSPEQVRPRSTPLDARTDVYSLGATLYELLTLRPPFVGTIQQLLADVPTRAPPAPRRLNPRVPRDLETIVLQSLEKEPGRRYATAGDLARDLRAFAAGVAPRARRARWPSRLLRAVKRHPARSAAIGLATLGAVALVALTTWAQEEGGARRLAEYRLLLQRAVVHPPPDAQEGASSAEGLYRQAIALAPGRPEAYEARALVGRWRLSERLADVDLARDRGMDAARAYLLKAYLFAEHGRNAEADEATAAAGAPAPEEEPLAWLVAAKRASKGGDHAAAEALVQRALVRLPVDSLLRHTALSDLLSLHLDLGESARALQDVHALQALGDDRLKLRATECWLWRRLDRASEADAAAEALIRRALENADDAFVVAKAWMAVRAHDWVDNLTERAVAAFPDDADLWGTRATVCTRRYRLVEALAAWDRATALAPGAGFLASRRASALLIAGRLAEASEASERATRLAPEDEEVWATRSDVLRQTGALEEAEAAARRAVSLSPQGSEADRALALALVARGRFDEAETVLVRRVRAAPRAVGDRIVLVRLRLQQERWKDALEEVEAVLDRAPDDPEAWKMRGEALRSLDRFEEAAESFRRSLAIRPDDRRTLYLLGHMLQAKLGRPAESVEVLKRLLAIDDKDFGAWRSLGGALKQLQKAEDALAAFQRAHALAPGDPLTRSDLGAQLIEVKRPQEALGILDQLLTESPDDMINRYNRALALSDLGRKDDAIREYEEVARRDPTDGVAFLEAAKLHQEAGRQDRAIDAYAKAVAADRGNVVFRHALALALLVAKQYPAAEQAAREALALAPQDAECNNLLGRTLSRQLRFEEALPFLDAAWRSEPGRIRYAQELVAACLNLDRAALAVDVLKDALRRFPDDRFLDAQMAWALADAVDLAVRDAVKAVLHGRRATGTPGAGAFEWFALGAALYRDGRHAEAVASLEKALAIRPDRVEPAASYFLAMALHRAGRAGDARLRFELAERQRLAAQSPETPDRHAAEAADVLGQAVPAGK